MTREVFRLKFRLAKILARQVGICKESSPKIMRVLHHEINVYEIKKSKATTKRVNKQLGFQGYLPLRVVGGAPQLHLSIGPCYHHILSLGCREKHIGNHKITCKTGI